MKDEVTCTLATGTLQLILAPGTIPLQRLLGFAARIGAKRKFLLVSKVLGKHYPVPLRLLRWSYRALARKVLAHTLASPSVWIGMAETATGLGYGVFEHAYLDNKSLKNVLFMQTTRYVLADRPYLAFDEAHSHATDFFLYYPEAPALQHIFLSARSLVLIDDEISTGRTFLHLIKAYQQINDNLQQVIIVSLVNFASDADRHYLQAQAGIEVIWICLRQGQLSFQDTAFIPPTQAPVNVIGNKENKQHLLAWPGRLGLAVPIDIDQADLASLINLMNNIKPCPHKIMVLGTGECNAPAYLLGKELTQRGYCVHLQSTTRSPIYVGNDISCRLTFKDNYEDDIDNFIYNFCPEAYDVVIICHETPVNAAIVERLVAWQAISARFELNATSATHANLHFFRP